MPTDWGSRQDNVVSVVASGEVRARANIMHLTFEVRTRGNTAAEALHENNLRDRSVRSRLRGAGVHEESIDASSISFLPTAGDGVSLPGATEPQGFIAVRTLTVNAYITEEEMNGLPSRIARILDEASEGGAQAGSRQQVNLAVFRSPCVSYGLDNDTDYRAEALRKAMISARMAGEEAAHSIGAEVDEIVSTQILELGALVQGRWSASAFGMPGLDTPRPPEAGRVVVRAVASVTFRVRQAPPVREHERERLGSQYTLEQADSTRSHADRAPELS